MADKQDILPPCVSAGATFIRMITHSLARGVCVCYVHLPGFRSIELNNSQQCRVVCGVTWKVNWQLEFIMHPLCQSVCLRRPTVALMQMNLQCRSTIVFPYRFLFCILVFPHSTPQPDAILHFRWHKCVCVFLVACYLVAWFPSL